MPFTRKRRPGEPPTVWVKPTSKPKGQRTPASSTTPASLTPEAKRLVQLNEEIVRLESECAEYNQRHQKMMNELQMLKGGLGKPSVQAEAGAYSPRASIERTRGSGTLSQPPSLSSLRSASFSSRSTSSVEVLNQTKRQEAGSWYAPEANPGATPSSRTSASSRSEMTGSSGQYNQHHPTRKQPPKILAWLAGSPRTGRRR